jgi:hypothetical protein
MAGTTRVITPRITMNQGNGTTDTGPVNIGAGTGTYTRSDATARLRRKAIYASGNPAVLPPVYAVAVPLEDPADRHRRPHPEGPPAPAGLRSGAVLFVRLWDPAAAAGLGAPIGLANLTRVNVQFGSGLLRFDAQTNGGTVRRRAAPAQWLENHDALLPPGVFAFDLALDERGRMSNKRALNVLTTSGIQVHMEFRQHAAVAQLLRRAGRGVPGLRLLTAATTTDQERETPWASSEQGTAVVDGQRVLLPPLAAFAPANYGPQTTGVPNVSPTIPPVMGVGMVGGMANSSGGVGYQSVNGYGTADNNAAAAAAAGDQPFSLKSSPVLWAVGLLVFGLVALQAINWHETVEASGKVGKEGARASESAGG